MAAAADRSTSNTRHVSHSCEQCGVRHRAMCAAVDFQHLGALEQIVSHRRYAPGQPIFEEGDEADYVYNLSDGEVRLYKLLPDGRRQITGFLQPGDFLGLIKRDTYAYGAEAIDAVELCCMRIGDLQRLLNELPVLRDRLLEMSRDELAAAQEQMLLLGRKTAREKVLTFLLMRAQREVEANARSAQIHLPMSRSDIADYLGLTIETVSRTFTALKDEGVILLPSAHRVEVPDLEHAEAEAGAE